MIIGLMWSSRLVTHSYVGIDGADADGDVDACARHDVGQVIRSSHIIRRLHTGRLNSSTADELSKPIA